MLSSRVMLSHYSDQPTFDLRPASYLQSAEFKPSGLWLSVDGAEDWPYWCGKEGFRLTALAYRHQFVLNDASRILMVTDTNGIDALSQGYGASAYSFGLDWSRLAREFGGLIIAPYQWERRLCSSSRWYYSWDCASGCIWDVSTVGYVGSEPFDVHAHVARLDAEWSSHAV